MFVFIFLKIGLIAVERGLSFFLLRDLITRFLLAVFATYVLDSITTAVKNSLSYRKCLNCSVFSLESLNLTPSYPWTCRMVALGQIRIGGEFKVEKPLNCDWFFF